MVVSISGEPSSIPGIRWECKSVFRCFRSTGSIKESFLANNSPKMPNVINYSVHHNNADKHR